MDETLTEPIALEGSGLGIPKIEMEMLESRALRATLWTVVSYGAAQSLRVVNSLVLTRLLVPSAFGQMTLVTTVIGGMIRGF
jgi:O-antigen/teichoic acid export membrane protein